MEHADDDHYASIVEKLAGGRMIPFLGAGANLCDRGDEEWVPGGPFLPSGGELARHLVTRGRYPEPEEQDLPRVSQFLDVARGEDELYLYLHEVFGENYEPTSLHRLLGQFARFLGEKCLPQLVVVTTNYDDLVEQALEAEGLEFDLVWYEAKHQSAQRGRFLHRSPGKKTVPIARPNKYAGLPIVLERPAILKLHGCLDRRSVTGDSYVITEDSYIDYLSGGDVGGLIPIALWNRLTSASLLFLGYALRDWNLRVILNRIWGTRTLVGKSWAIQREPADPAASRIEQTLWEARENVELVYCELGEYVRQIKTRLPVAEPA